MENSAVATGLEKVSFHSSPKEGQSQRILNYHTTAFISHASKFMLKTLDSNTWSENFHLYKLGLEKAEEPEIKLPTSIGASKKQESSRKTSYFCFINYAKVFDCVDHNKL